MTGEDRTSPLDRPAARLAAVTIALAGLAFLGWMHRNDLFPPEPGAAPGDPREAAFQACFAPGRAHREGRGKRPDQRRAGHPVPRPRRSLLRRQGGEGQVGHRLALLFRHFEPWATSI